MRDRYDLQEDIDVDDEPKHNNLDEEQLPEVLERAQLPTGPKRKYGNMVVIYQGKILVTLGPDYWCFLPTFLIFCAISICSIWFVLSNSQNIYLQLSAILVCGGMPLSYLAVATSNPGIVTESQPHSAQMLSSTTASSQTSSSQKRKSTTKQCKRCNIIVKRTTYHCADCDVCVRDYDHHCPWTSKCIGGGNLKRFYLFLVMIPVFIFYFFVVFGVVMSSIAMNNMASAKKL